MIEEKFNTIYTSARTIAFLPSVRNIDRNAKNLSDDAKSSIQQIYNNLSTAISVSELYIVDDAFNPNKINPETKKLEEPILSFDEFITSPKDIKSEKIVGEPEIEKYEYEQYVNSILEYRKIKPVLCDEDLSKLNIPLLCGPEVITCDNTEFNRTKIDEDRMGILFTVPFYGNNSQLKGLVTVNIRSNEIRKWLPEKNYVLTNTAYQ
jgi:hypothetical protein